MNVGFSEQEYSRVREWLLSAMEPAPDKISEAELLANLRSSEWVLITTDHAAAVLQLCEIDGEKIANVLLLGGEKNKALREIIAAYQAVCSHLKARGFAKLVGQPRIEFHAILRKLGFQKGQEELFKEL